MASPQAAAEYRQDALEVIADLEEDGRIVSFGNRGDGNRPWEPSSNYVELFEAPIFPIEWDQNFSDDVRKDDRMYIAGAANDLTQCSVVVDDGVEHTIIKTKPFKPDGVVIYYEIQVRT